MLPSRAASRPLYWGRCQSESIRAWAGHTREYQRNQLGTNNQKDSAKTTFQTFPKTFGLEMYWYEWERRQWWRWWQWCHSGSLSVRLVLYRGSAQRNVFIVSKDGKAHSTQRDKQIKLFKESIRHPLKSSGQESECQNDTPFNCLLKSSN